MPKLIDSEESSRPHRRIGEIRALAEQGLSRAEISRRTGINYNTVKSLCNLHSLKPPRPVRETLARVRELAPHYTRNEIADRLGLSYSSIRNLCLRHDITPIDSPRYHGNGSAGFHDRGVQLENPMEIPDGLAFEDADVPAEVGRFIPPPSDYRSRTTAAVAVDHPMAGVGL